MLEPVFPQLVAFIAVTWCCRQSYNMRQFTARCPEQVVVFAAATGAALLSQRLLGCLVHVRSLAGEQSASDKPLWRQNVGLPAGWLA